jgi:hypothetical protein
MARAFNGTSDRIDLANEANFDFERTQPFSVAAWWQAGKTGGGTIVGKHDVTGGDLGWILLSRFGVVSPTVAFNLRGGITFCNAFTTTEWSLDIWRHILWTYNGNSLVSGNKIYIDGVDQALTTQNDDLADSILNNIPCQIGARDGTITPGFFLKGGVAGVGIWNVVLDQSDATALAGGADPYYIRNLSEIACLDLCGASPEADKKGTNNGTLTGTVIAGNPALFTGCPNPGDDPTVGIQGRGAGW